MRPFKQSTGLRWKGYRIQALGLRYLGSVTCLYGVLGGDSVHDAVRDPEARDKTSTKPLKQLLCTDLYQLL